MKRRFNNLVRDVATENLVNEVLDSVYANPECVKILPARNKIQWWATSSGVSRGGRIETGYAFTISIHALTAGGEDYVRYLICHELSHVSQVFTHSIADHGPTFMNALKTICPKHLQHFEYGYKPRMASRCGVSLDSSAASEVTGTIYVKIDNFFGVKFANVNRTYKSNKVRAAMVSVLNEFVAMYPNSRISVRSTPFRGSKKAA